MTEELPTADTPALIPDGLEELRAAALARYDRAPGEPTTGYVHTDDDKGAVNDTFDAIDVAVQYTAAVHADLSEELETTAGDFAIITEGLAQQISDNATAVDGALSQLAHNLDNLDNRDAQQHAATVAALQTNTTEHLSLASSIGSLSTRDAEQHAATVAALQANTTEHAALAARITSLETVPLVLWLDCETAAKSLTLPKAATSRAPIRVIKTGPNLGTVNRATGDTLTNGRTSITMLAEHTTADVLLVPRPEANRWEIVEGNAANTAVGARRWEWSRGAALTNTTPSGGWTLTHGDTGWRDVTAQLLNGWAALFVGIRRTNNAATVFIQNLNPAAATSADFLPVFGVVVREPAGRSASVPCLGGGGVLSIGGVNLQIPNYAANRASLVNGTYSWAVTVAQNAWPSTLPGVAIGAVPV